ncbi:hypothetical protein JCM5353_006211 [Sporobolomyces roseus]
MFNEIVTPLLYLEPQLGTRNSAELWARTYHSKANPWTVTQREASLKDVVVPRKITLVPLCRDVEDRRLNEADEDATPVSLFRYNTILTPFFFRNLTSFTASEPLVDNHFVAALFGPTGSNRTTITHLAIDISRRSQNLVLFLLQAFPYFSWEGNDPTGFMGVLDDNRDYAEQAWQRFIEEGLPDDEMNRIRDKLDKVALECFSVFDQHYLSEPDSFDFLPEVFKLKNQISTSPFANLRNLSLTVFSNAELALIFLTPLFPRLHNLKLNGLFYTTIQFENNVRMLRFSITKRGGKILPPFACSLECIALIEACSWNPLSEQEMEEYQCTTYQGPNLDLLDLSCCHLHEGMG